MDIIYIGHFHSARYTHAVRVITNAASGAFQAETAAAQNDNTQYFDAACTLAFTRARAGVCCRSCSSNARLLCACVRSDADFNGDSLPDLMLANVVSDHQLFFSGSIVANVTLNNPNKGNANPIANQYNLWESKPVAIAVGDTDGDGDTDIVVAPGVQLFLNDGSGNFTEATSTLNIAYTGTPASNTNIVTVALGDLNGDGSLDLVLGSGAVYLNDGTGTFVAGAGVAFDVHPVAIGIAELTGDAHLDLIRVRTSTMSTEATTCYVDNTAAFIPCTTGCSANVACTTSISLKVLELYVGAGDGTFIAQSGSATLASLQTGAFSGALFSGDGSDFYNKQVSLGDLDADGDLDLFTGISIAVNQNDGTWAIGSSSNGVYLVADANAGDAAGVPYCTASALADFDGDGVKHLLSGTPTARAAAARELTLLLYL